MTPRLAAIRRHPVKSVGWEPLETVALAPLEALPGDRTWAVAHGASRFDFERPAWTPCGEFLRVTYSPRLAQVRARLEDGRLTLSHPEAETLAVDPEAEPQAVADWAGALASHLQSGPYRLAQAPGEAMTDADEPWIAIGSLASLRALSERIGVPLDPSRFRANFWLDGLAPWEERAWIGREIAIGATRLRITEAIVRCAATEANPETGRRDAPVVAHLRALCDAPEFAVYAEVIEGGTVALGDAVRA